MKTRFIWIGFIFAAISCVKDESKLPKVTTSLITELSWNYAIAGGEVIDDGGYNVTARGICATTDTNNAPTIIADHSNWQTVDSFGIGSFTSKIDIHWSSYNRYTHYIRAYATNRKGTGYGDVITFYPKSRPPTSSSIELVTVTAKTTSAIISFRFDHTPYYDIDERGFCYGTSPNPTIDATRFVLIMTDQLYRLSSPTVILENLLPSTNYFIRGYVKNETEIYYTPQISCKTMEGEITDINGNIYQIKTIGNQVWTIENLQTSNFNDGTIISNIQENLIWNSTTTSAYAIYDNAKYGKLYNYYAVSDSRKLCPTGWHIPSDDEWKTLELNLGMAQSEVDRTGFRGTVEGGALKQTGCPTAWSCQNIGATNSYNFSAVGGGYRYDNGIFSDEGNSAYFWSNSEYDASTAWSRSLSRSNTQIGRLNIKKGFGFSVRCLKD